MKDTNIDNYFIDGDIISLNESKLNEEELFLLFDKYNTDELFQLDTIFSFIDDDEIKKNLNNTLNKYSEKNELIFNEPFNNRLSNLSTKNNLLNNSELVFLHNVVEKASNSIPIEEYNNLYEIVVEMYKYNVSLYNEIAYRFNDNMEKKLKLKKDL